MKKLTLPVVILCALFSASCSKKPTASPSTTATATGTITNTANGTTTGNGGATTKTSPKMGYKLKAINAFGSLKTTGTINWNSVTASPSYIKFEAKRDASEIEYKTSIAGSVDLMASSATYFGGFNIPSGTYNEIELKIQLVQSSSPAFEMNGQFSSGAKIIPIKVLINESVLLKTETHNTTIPDNDSMIAVANFNLSNITTGITENLIISGTLTAGTLVISSTSNASLYSIILQNLKNHDHHYEIEHHK